MIPLALFYLPFHNHGQCDAFRMTKWRENTLACVCLCVRTHWCERVHEKKERKIRQMLNNGLACVKMNTVIGINDLMGA